MQADHLRLDEIVRGLVTKSDKIRALGRENVPTAEIAKYLDIRYQHARNVLVDSGLHPAKAQNGQSEQAAHPEVISPVDAKPEWVEVDAHGRVQLSTKIRSAVGINPGMVVHVRVEGDTIEILTQRAAVKRARDIVRKFVPPGVSLVDELIAERRREARKEDEGS